MLTVDRFVARRGGAGRIINGWRFDRYSSSGSYVVYNFRTRQVKVGVMDSFGDLRYPQSSAYIDASQYYYGHPCQQC